MRLRIGTPRHPPLPPARVERLDGTLTGTSVRSLALFALPRIQDLWERLASYNALAAAFELAVIWVVVLLIVRFVQGTRAAGVMKGMLVLIVVATLVVHMIGGGQAFPRLSFLYERFLAVVAIGLVVIFQPELRRALIRLGEAPFFRSSPGEIAQVVGPIVEACAYLAKSRFGAIIVLERQVGLAALTEGGTRLDAALSARLLQTIFFPGTALHDLAVVVRGRVIHAANVQLPLADPGDMPDPSLGARHRAAVGLSRECDAIVVVVSEERGSIRVCERGRFTPTLTPDQLRDHLKERLTRIRQSATASQEPEPAPESSGGANGTD